MLAQNDAKKMEKNGKNNNPKNKFDYVTGDDIVNESKRILIKRGILFIPTIDSHEQVENRTQVRVLAKFINVDKPEELFESFAIGYGCDGQDKGPGKAYSYACKYVLAKTLMLNTSDDIEEFDEEFKPAQALESAERDVKLWSSNLKRAIESCTSYDALKKIRSDNSEMMKRPVVPDVTREYFENEISEKLSILKEAIIKDEVSEDA